MVGAPVRRRQVAYLHGGGLSVRRACALMSVARSTLRNESRLGKRAASVVAAAWSASTQKAAAAARGSASAKTFVAHGSEPSLGIRLSVRRLCQWPAAEVPDGDR